MQGGAVSRIRQRLTFANVVSVIALFVALGGTALASVIITSNSQVDRATISGHHPPSGKHPNIISGSVNGTDLASGAVSNGELADGAVTAPKLACKGNGPSDQMVRAGAVCIDKYEASVWSSPTGGTQYGVNADDYPCGNDGQDCKGKIFARSVAGVTPSSRITWFQAQAALANVGKRLPTNAEWQQAVQGTPKDQCNTGDGVAQATGSFTNCVSDWGAYDMVGNVSERVADWDELAGGCDTWIGGEPACLGGTSTTAHGYAPLERGDNYNSGASAGPFVVRATTGPTSTAATLGFRGAR